LLGKIFVSGGSSNTALEENGEVFLLKETKLWLAMLFDGGEYEEDEDLKLD